MCADPVSGAVVDRAYLQIHGLERAKRALDVGQRLVVAHALRRIHLCRGHGRADNIDAVQRRLGGDAVRLARERKRGVADHQIEMFGDLVLVDHLACAQADLLAAGEFAPIHPDLDLGEADLCGGQEILAFMRAQLCKFRVATRHQAFARIVG